MRTQGYQGMRSTPDGPRHYHADEKGNLYDQPEGEETFRADSPSSEPCGPGTVPVWAESFRFPFEQEGK